MNTVWLDPMEEEEELNAFLLEEQLIMNHHQQQQQQQINDVPRQQVLMNTIAINTTTTAAASLNTRAEDIISWLDTEEDDDDDDGDVYIPSLPAADDHDTADDGQEVLLQENLYNNLQMDHRHQVEEGGELLLFHNNNQEDQTLIMDAFHHHPQPTIINPDNVDHFQVPESPFLLDLLCNINEFDILHSSHNHHHRAVAPEEIPPKNDYHQPSSSCSSPPLVDQNLFFDDPDMSEFTLINDVGNSHDTVTNTTTVQLVDTSSSTSRDHHINEDHSRSNENVINNVSTMIDKVTVNATNGVTAVNQGDDDENDDDDENNGHEEKSMDAHGDNSKAMISTNTSTTSPLALASASAVACKNLVSERNRRKRLSQQLLALRSLVPNITKMDKRSVLVDALAYLRNLHEETTKLQNELKQQPSPPQSNTMISSTTATDTASCPADNLTAGNLCNPRMLPRNKPRAIITEIDTEKIENQRFVVKITCKVRGGNSSSSSSGVCGDVLRVMESLGFDITYSSTTTTPPPPLYHQASKPQNQQFLLTTLFIRVRNNKHGKMTEEKLRECISNRALRCGLTFQKQPPPPTTTTIVP